MLSIFPSPLKYHIHKVDNLLISVSSFMILEKKLLKKQILIGNNLCIVRSVVKVIQTNGKTDVSNNKGSFSSGIKG